MFGLKFTSERARRGWSYAVAYVCIAMGAIAALLVTEEIARLYEIVYGAAENGPDGPVIMAVLAPFVVGWGATMAAATMTRKATEEKVYQDIERAALKH